MNASSVSLNAPPSPFRNVSTRGPDTTREKSTLWATSPSESAAVTVTTVVPSGVPAEVVSVKIALHVGSHSGGLKEQDAPPGRLAHEYCTSSVDPDRMVSVTVVLIDPPGVTDADVGSMDIVKSNSGGGAGGVEILRVKFAVREIFPSVARMTTSYDPSEVFNEVPRIRSAEHGGPQVVGVKVHVASSGRSSQANSMAWGEPEVRVAVTFACVEFPASTELEDGLADTVKSNGGGGGGGGGGGRGAAVVEFAGICAGSGPMICGNLMSTLQIVALAMQSALSTYSFGSVPKFASGVPL